jgi:hypothetical protein
MEKLKIFTQITVICRVSRKAPFLPKIAKIAENGDTNIEPTYVGLDAIFLPYSLMHMYIYTYRSQ